MNLYTKVESKEQNKSSNTNSRFKNLSLTSPKTVKIKNRGYFYTSSVSQDFKTKRYDNSSVAIKEAGYRYGWSDGVKVLSEEEFIKRIRSRK